MDRPDFYYQIPDERLIAYSRLTPLERLRWLDEVRRFTLLVRSAPTVAAAPAKGTSNSPCSETLSRQG